LSYEDVGKDAIIPKPLILYDNDEDDIVASEDGGEYGYGSDNN
jgi:hypothetical protein